MCSTVLGASSGKVWISKVPFTVSTTSTGPAGRLGRRARGRQRHRRRHEQQPQRERHDGPTKTCYLHGSTSLAGNG